MGEKEPVFRSREEADAYLQSELGNRGCDMVAADRAPKDLEQSLLGGETEPSWRIDVKGLCSILLYVPTQRMGPSLKPGEYIYRFYFGGKETAQHRGSAADILRSVDANLRGEKERQETRRELDALIRELGGAAHEISEIPSDLKIGQEDNAYVVGDTKNVVRVDFPDRVTALIRRPSGRYFAGDFFLNGDYKGGNHDWAVGDVRYIVQRLTEDARRLRGRE